MRRASRDDDIEWLRDLRGRLTRAWDAVDEETAVAELNTILAGARAQPWLARRDGRSEFRYDRPGLPIRQFGDALASRALLEEIAAGRWARFGRCVAAPCRCVFVDRTRRRAPLLLPALRRPRGPPGVQAASPLLTFAPSYRHRL